MFHLKGVHTRGGNLTEQRKGPCTLRNALLSALPMIPPTSNKVDKSADVVGLYNLPPIPEQIREMQQLKNYLQCISIYNEQICNYSNHIICTTTVQDSSIHLINTFILSTQQEQMSQKLT